MSVSCAAAPSANFSPPVFPSHSFLSFLKSWSFCEHLCPGSGHTCWPAWSHDPYPFTQIEPMPHVSTKVSPRCCTLLSLSGPCPSVIRLHWFCLHSLPPSYLALGLSLDSWPTLETSALDGSQVSSQDLYTAQFLYSFCVQIAAWPP